jgi:hypothetical protein
LLEAKKKLVKAIERSIFKRLGGTEKGKLWILVNEKRRNSACLLMGSTVIEPKRTDDNTTLSPTTSCDHPFTETAGMDVGGQPIYRNRLYFLPCQEIPEAKKNVVYFSTDDIYTYHPFCDVISM